jgi:hypothetical protein
MRRWDRCRTLARMRDTHSCPKCPSIDIVRIPGDVGAYGAGNNITVGATRFSSVLVTRHLCASCGFSEEWVDDNTGLEKLRAK